MTDPANATDDTESPAEIEDVLLSIRRLVSEKQAQFTSPNTTAAAPTSPMFSTPPKPSHPTASEEPKLVLTPAQRVSDPDDPWAPVSSPDPSFAAPEEDAPLSTQQDLPQDEPAAPTEDLPQETPVRTERLYDWADIAGKDLEARNPFALRPDPEAPPPPTPACQPEHAETETAEAEADMTGSVTDIPFDFLKRAARPPEPEQSDAPEQQTPATEPAQATDDEPPSTEWDAGADTATGGTTDADTPDTGADTETDTRADNLIDDFGEGSSPFSFPESSDTILDEETLREMIIEIVREELQGVMGQRITRNVRKMVRREIRLALAMEDLD